MFLKNGPNLEGSFLKSAKYYRAFLIFRKIFKSKLKTQQSTEKHSKAQKSTAKQFKQQKNTVKQTCWTRTQMLCNFLGFLIKKFRLVHYKMTFLNFCKKNYGSFLNYPKFQLVADLFLISVFLITHTACIYILPNVLWANLFLRTPTN